MTEPGEVLRPFTLRGGRYEESGFPLEALPELARYERLVQDVARSLWKEGNPDRQRLPRGFGDRMRLRLIDVEPGSTVPVLSRPGDLSVDSSSTFSSRSEADVFDDAVRIVEDTFSAIAADKEFPPSLPLDLLPEFVRFGSTFRANERAEFSKDGEVYTYNQGSRRTLLSRTTVQNYPVEGSIAGRVTSLDAERQQFRLTTLNGEIIPGNYENRSLTSDLRAVLDSRSHAQVVRLEGTFSIRGSNAVAEIQDVIYLELFEVPGTKWSDRLIEIASLPRGWLGEEQGLEVAFPALDFARDLLREITDKLAASPGIFPTPDGGVQLEWQGESTTVSVEISPWLDVRLYAYDEKTDDEQAEEDANVSRASDFIARHLQ
jgi:hypothetical protein